MKVIGDTLLNFCVGSVIGAIIYCVTHSVTDTSAGLTVLWRSLDGACVGAVIVFGGLLIEWVRLKLRAAWERRSSQALPTLGITLPGLEEMIASQGGDRWTGRRSSARQPIDQARRRTRVEPRFDKPVG